MVHHSRVRTAAVAVVATLLAVGTQWISPQAHSVPASSPECQLLEPLESTTSYQVPAGVDRVLLEAYGTGGDPSSTNPGSAATGRGVTLIGSIAVTAGDWLSSNGASWFRKVGSDYAPVLEAGSGGGSSYVGQEVTLVTATLQTSPLASHVSARAYACSPIPSAVTAFTTPMTRLGYVCTGPKAYPYVGVPADFTVPAGEQFALIEAIGALGGGRSTVLGDSGGAGGAATGVLAVTGGQVLQVRVGGAGSTDAWAMNSNVPPGLDTLPGGYNGGGDAMRGVLREAWTFASGGGASDVRVAPYGLTQRVVVGGGGGAGDSYNHIPGGSGGQTGGNGTIQPLDRAVSEADINAVIAASQPLLAGTGGTSQGPGVNGLYRQQTLTIFPLALVDEPEPNPARDPAAGVGGDATASGILPGRGVPLYSFYLGGGGGWYGGGAGGSLYVQGGHEVQEEVTLGGSGGGGSSYAVASSAGLPAAVFSDGVEHGDGLVRIATCHRGAKPKATAKPASTRGTTPTLEGAAGPSTDLPSITPAASSVGASLDSGSPTPSTSGDASKTAESVVPGQTPGEPMPWWLLAIAVGALGVLGAGGVFFVLVRRRRRAQ